MNLYLYIIRINLLKYQISCKILISVINNFFFLRFSILNSSFLYCHQFIKDYNQDFTMDNF